MQPFIRLLLSHIPVRWPCAWTLTLLLASVALSIGVAPSRAQPAATPPTAVAEAKATPAGSAARLSVSINSADAAELAAALDGVGQRKAEAIVRYREQFGPFGSVEELTEVRGIGSATLERNRAVIRLD